MKYHHLNGLGWILSGLLIALVVFAYGCRQSVAKSSNISESFAQTVESNDAQIVKTPQLTILLSDAKVLLDDENAILIDIRPLSAYEISHITGSISIPVTELENRLREIPKDKRIIVYAQCH